MDLLLLYQKNDTTTRAAVSKKLKKTVRTEIYTYKNDRMDKYLTIFSEQLDKEFKPETLFPGKEIYSIGWLKRKFIIIKNGKKQLKETSMVNNIAAVEYV